MLDVVPLIVVMCACAGYVFCNTCLHTKYSLARDDGQRFYVKVLSWGVPFTILCVLTHWLTYALPELLNFSPWFMVAESYSVVLTLLVTPLLALACAEIYNKVVSEDKKVQLFFNAMCIDDFDAVLLEAIESFEPVAISMENRKIYVGYVYTTLEPGVSNSHLTILPFLSGFRDKDTLKFNISARYEVVIEGLRALAENGDGGELSRYTLAVPRSRIISLHLFSHDLHDDVNEQYKAMHQAEGTASYETRE